MMADPTNPLDEAESNKLWQDSKTSYGVYIKPRRYKKKMAIHYGCVAVGRHTIVADCSLESKKNFRAVVLSMLPNIATEPNVKRIYLHKRYNFAVLPDNGLFYICATSPAFEDEKAFEFLNEVVQEFNSENNNLVQELSNENGAGRTDVDVEREGHDDVDGELDVTVVDGVKKKIRKFPGALKKKMKKIAKGKSNKKSKIFPIPSRNKARDQRMQSPPYVTPGTRDTYYPLDEEEHEEIYRDVEVGVHEESAGAYVPHGRSINSLQHEVEEVQGIVREAVEKVLKRGENIDELLQRADNLKDAAYQFQKTTKKVKRKYRWRNRKLICAVATGTGSALTVAGIVLTLVLVGII